MSIRSNIIREKLSPIIEETKSYYSNNYSYKKLQLDMTVDDVLPGAISTLKKHKHLTDKDIDNLQKLALLSYAVHKSGERAATWRGGNYKKSTPDEAALYFPVYLDRSDLDDLDTFIEMMNKMFTPFFPEIFRTYRAQDSLLGTMLNAWEQGESVETIRERHFVDGEKVLSAYPEIFNELSSSGATTFTSDLKNRKLNKKTLRVAEKVSKAIFRSLIEDAYGRDFKDAEETGVYAGLDLFIAYAPKDREYLPLMSRSSYKIVTDALLVPKARDAIERMVDNGKTAEMLLIANYLARNTDGYRYANFNLDNKPKTKEAMFCFIEKLSENVSYKDLRDSDLIEKKIGLILHGRKEEDMPNMEELFEEIKGTLTLDAVRDWNNLERNIQYFPKEIAGKVIHQKDSYHISERLGETGTSLVSDIADIYEFSGLGKRDDFIDTLIKMLSYQEETLVENGAELFKLVDNIDVLKEAPIEWAKNLLQS